jgi:hypothetical protein
MRRGVRRAVVAVLLMSFSLSLAGPALAAQWIRYRGETSASSYNRVLVFVKKKDDGRRFIEFISVRITLICEDAAEIRQSAILGIGKRLPEDGSFERIATGSEFDIAPNTFYIRVAGQVGFRTGSGTYVKNEAALTSDGMDVQMCTTGELTWTVERDRTMPSLAHRHPSKGELSIQARGN